MPHFGARGVPDGAGDEPAEDAVAFADRAFHLGWAELITSWLLLLAGEQLGVSIDSGVLHVSETLDADAASIQRGISIAISNSKRCYVEEADGYFFFQNFRRGTTGQPRRIALG